MKAKKRFCRMLRIIARLKPDGFLDAAQVAFDQRDAGAFHRDVRAGAHGNTDIGGGERGRVVDAVARHRDDVPLLAQFADALVFVLRLDASFDFIDAELLGDGSAVRSLSPVSMITLIPS